jgi:hypothetical protein
MLEKKLVKYAKQAYIKKIQELFFDDQFLISDMPNPATWWKD